MCLEIWRRLLICDCRKNFTVKAGLTLNGTLHVKGDMEVNGSVSMKKGSELIVDGRRTIHGSIKET